MADLKYYASNKDKYAAVWRERNQEFPWKHLISTAKNRAKNKGLCFDLTHKWGEVRWTGHCELTGLPFDLSPGKRTSIPFSPSLDRIDPKLGYVQENCRFILFGINAMKGNGTDAQLFRIAKAVAGVEMGIALLESPLKKGLAS